MGVDKAGDAIFQPTLPVRGVTTNLLKREREKKFQPTLPVRGVTRSCSAATGTSRISTHTPRAGSDLHYRRIFANYKYFNPHSPCGE